MLDVAFVTASHSLAIMIAAITASRLLAVAAVPNRFATNLSLTCSDCRCRVSEREITPGKKETTLPSERENTPGKKRPHLGAALEVQVHRRRQGGDDVNRLAATLSLTSSPPRERERSVFCCTVASSYKAIAARSHALTSPSHYSKSLAFSTDLR